MVIDNSGKGLASLGRAEDKFLAHVAPGERVVPPVISSDTQARLSKEMVAAGLDPDKYIVGPHMSINPVSGQPEFGWLKKTAKSLKKAVKKIAPIAAVIPGPWQPFAVVYNKSEEHTSELQSPCNLVCRLLLEKKQTTKNKLKQTSKGEIDRIDQPI